MKTLINFLLIFSISFLNLSGYAQSLSTKSTKPEDTKKTIYLTLTTTNSVISSAFKQVQKNKIYTGSLAKATKHQQIAKQFLAENNHFRALHHSRLARTYAIKAIRLNKGNISETWSYSAEEQQLFGQGIADEELSEEMKKKYPSANFLDEEVKWSDLEKNALN